MTSHPRSYFSHVIIVEILHETESAVVYERIGPSSEHRQLSYQHMLLAVHHRAETANPLHYTLKTCFHSKIPRARLRDHVFPSAEREGRRGSTTTINFCGSAVNYRPNVCLLHTFITLWGTWGLSLSSHLSSFWIFLPLVSLISILYCRESKRTISEHAGIYLYSTLTCQSCNVPCFFMQALLRIFSHHLCLHAVSAKHEMRK